MEGRRRSVQLLEMLRLRLRLLVLLRGDDGDPHIERGHARHGGGSIEQIFAREQVLLRMLSW